MPTDHDNNINDNDADSIAARRAARLQEMTETMAALMETPLMQGYLTRIDRALAAQERVADAMASAAETIAKSLKTPEEIAADQAVSKAQAAFWEALPMAMDAVITIASRVASAQREPN
jgi:hypothetical protein